MIEDDIKQHIEDRIRYLIDLQNTFWSEHGRATLAGRYTEIRTLYMDLFGIDDNEFNEIFDLHNVL